MSAAPGKPLRIVIADDHPIFRNGLRRLLELLFKAIRSVVAGQYWLRHGTFMGIVRHLRELTDASRREATPADRLTARERQVIAGVATGESNREIAIRLGLSEITVAGPHDIPASIAEGSYEVVVDAGVREDGETPGHYRAVLRFRYPALARSCSASQERSSSKEASISSGCSWEQDSAACLANHTKP